MNKKLLQQTIIVTIVNLIIATIINLLAWQFKLVSGGLTGYALIINFITGFPPGVILLVSNLILLVIAFFVLGKGLGAKAVYGFVSFSIFIDLTRYVMQLQQSPTDNFFLGLGLIVILSIVMGTGMSIILANEYSVGAYSTIFMIIEKFIKVPAQNVFFILDFILAVISGFIFGWERAVFLFVNAIVAYFVVKLVLPRAKKYFATLNLLP